MSNTVKLANQPRRIAILRLLFVLMITGVLGRFWAILYIGSRKNQTVMMLGPYSMCRHPLYFFSTVAVTGLGLLLGSLVLAGFMSGTQRERR